MGPVRYLKLRTLNLIRKALQNADPWGDDCHRSSHPQRPVGLVEAPWSIRQPCRPITGVTLAVTRFEWIRQLNSIMMMVRLFESRSDVEGAQRSPVGGEARSAE